MRVTAVLLKQHVQRMFENKWKIQSKRKILDKGVKARLEAMGIPVYNAKDLVGLTPEPEAKIDIPEIDDGKIDPSILPGEPPLDSRHPDWHEKPCFNYHDHVSLLAGLDQGLNLVKAQLVEQNLPKRVNELKKEADETIHERVKKAILHSHLLDAAQDKLPKVVDVKRPGWNYPREYGIPRWRKNKLLMDNLFRICESQLIAEKAQLTKTHIATEIKVKVAMELNDETPLLFTIEPDYIFLNKTPLKPYGENISQQPLPSIYPLSPTVNLKKGNIYRLDEHFPSKSNSPFAFPSMAVFFMNQPIIRGNDSTYFGRLLVHSFAVAAGQAHNVYGNKVKDLAEPITLNAVQTDGKNFYFGALQLNSLDIGQSDNIARNYFWLREKVPLFETCEYQEKRPTLEGYNPEVINTLLALYRSQLL